MANDKGHPNGRMHVFPLTKFPGRYHVQIDNHVIGVLTFGANGATIERVKVGIREDGRGVYEPPPGWMSKPFKTTGEAADKVLTHWLGLDREALDRAA
jgi:hypothetical protein